VFVERIQPIVLIFALAHRFMEPKSKRQGIRPAVNDEKSNMPLVAFAISATQFYRCLELSDRSRDRAVSSVDRDASDSQSAHVQFSRLSQFLAALCRGPA
jgi:hypothetical protein